MQRALAAAEERLKDGVSNLASLEEERHAAKSKEEALQVSTAVPLHMTCSLSMLAEPRHSSCCRYEHGQGSNPRIVPYREGESALCTQIVKGTCAGFEGKACNSDCCLQKALAAAEERLSEKDSNRASLEAQLRAAQLQASSAIQARSPLMRWLPSLEHVITFRLRTVCNPAQVSWP